MRRFPSLGSFRFALLTLAACLIAAGSALAADILQLYSGSMNTMLPTSATAVQSIRPIAAQRGVNVDGSLRAAPAFAIALQGNPFESTVSGKQRMGDIRLDLGSYQPSVMDIALPTKGPMWPVGRTFNSRQESGGSHFDGGSFMGVNWTLSSQPEILLYTDPTPTPANDILYLVYGAGAYVEFRRYNGSSNQFYGINGASGVFDYQAGTPDLWVYTDQRGTQYTFLGFDTSGGTHNGLLWKVLDPDNNCAFVGDSSSVSTAISTGWDAAGRILYAYDATDRRFTHSYTTLNSVVRLTQVKAETKTSGSWASPSGVSTVATVDYTYYGTSEDYGSVGDLKLVTVTTPLTDSGVSSIRKSYMRYYKGTWDTTTNPGHDHEIQYVFDSEGLRRFDYAGDSTFDEDFLIATNDTLKVYAASFMEYDSSRRVRKFWSNGQCGCGGGANGAFELTYDSVALDTGGYSPAALNHTIIKRPDGSYQTQAFDELSQPLDEIVSDIEPGTGTPKYWAQGVTRDAVGNVNRVGTPASLDVYDHDAGSVTLKTGAGKVGSIVRVSSGDMTGFLADRMYKTGSGGTSYFEESLTYTSITKTIGDVTLVRPLIASKREYTINDSTGTTGSNLTSYSYAAWSGTLAVETVTVTMPAVSTGNNGSNAATYSYAHYRKDGLQDFAKDHDGHITYTEYTNGQATTHIEDADTASITEPTGFTSSGTALAKRTVTTYDAQGRVATVSPSFGANAAYNVQANYYSRLKDQRLVTLRYADYDSGTPRFYGPVQYSVTNHAGRGEVSGVIAVAGGGTVAAQADHIDETLDDPITAVEVSGATFGSVAQMSVSIYDELGRQLDEERRFFLIPSSGAGVDGTNYDPTLYGYDDSGRRWRVKEATGTIRRTVYDLMGRATEQWIGTNDKNFSGGESGGTDNMVKVGINVYDGPSPFVGNGHLTSHTLRVEDSSTGERTTTYSYDTRGRRILETPPLAPYTVSKFDNLGRVVATGLYSSSSGLTVTTDPTSTATNRMALSESAYDELGRTWKSIRHNIDASDGSDDDTLTALTWYDAHGHMIKSDGQGGLTKTAYDRLGRTTDSFVLAVDNDSSYTDADDVIGDIVFEQHQTRYDTANGTVILQASIGRLNTDISTGETTAELDTNADTDALKLTSGNVKGRTQISAMWYDALERLENRVEYGTNDATANIATFDRSGLSVPSRSDTALVTTTAYNTDGTVLSTTDPRGLVMRFEYDAEGRRTKEIRNYGDGVPSGTDSDVTVRYEFTNGLRTKLVADLPSGQTDQETVYTFGTTKGTGAGDSKIATGHLPQKTTFPDSSEASDVVTFAYNAQGQEIWKKDQATTSPAAGGSVIETDFDTRGRQTQRRVSTLGTGLDGAVRRIMTTFDSLGRTSLVTQFDNATVGSGSVVDEVKYSYDGWGNISKFEQDRNGTVGGGGDQYTVSYAWVKATNGRNTLRKDTMTLPSGKVLTFKYRTRNGLHDEEASRVTDLMDGGVSLPNYDYVGAGQVVGTDYPEADVMWKLYSGTGTSATYPDLDRFNRVVKSRWTKDLISADKDLYYVDLTYDRNSNITSADDSVHAGFDVKYAMDNTDRLTDADEGTLASGSISSRTRRQQWTLSQTGNWDEDKLDLTGDGDWSDTDEWDDCRNHNVVNELTARNTNCAGGNEYTLAYDPAGNMTDDGKDYEYEWDAFYRLRKVKKTTNQALVAEYKYNGLGFRIAVHEDTDTDNDVDSNDKWYHDAFDERWRQVARYRESDSSPKEEFVAHQAGNDGRGGSSYIDLVACRYKDANTAWTSASDGTLEERVYYCQNQHADVSAIVSSAGGILEWAKYSAYGVPFGLPGGDTNSDGDCDAADATQIQTWIDAPVYDVRGDLDLDGDVDGADKATAQGAPHSGSIGGQSQLSSMAGNRRALEGLNETVCSVLDARNRFLSTEYGQWLSRDPIAFSEGTSLYESMQGKPIIRSDPMGQTSISVNCEKRRCELLGPSLRCLFTVHSTSACPAGLSRYLVTEVANQGYRDHCNGAYSTDWDTVFTEFIPFESHVAPLQDAGYTNLYMFGEPSEGSLYKSRSMRIGCIKSTDLNRYRNGKVQPLGPYHGNASTVIVAPYSLSDVMQAGVTITWPDSSYFFWADRLIWNCCPGAITWGGGGGSGAGSPSDPSPASTPSPAGGGASTPTPPTPPHTSGGGYP